MTRGPIVHPLCVERNLETKKQRLMLNFTWRGGDGGGGGGGSVRHFKKWVNPL